MTDLEKNFPSALLALRSRLGVSQDRIAKMLDCPTSTYQRWEYGKNMPEGGVILQILRLCPDAETLAAFGILQEDVKQGLPRRLPEGTTAKLLGIAGSGTPGQRRRITEQQRKAAEEAIVALYHLGRLGLMDTHGVLSDIESRLRESATEEVNLAAKKDEIAKMPADKVASLVGAVGDKATAAWAKIAKEHMQESKRRS